MTDTLFDRTDEDRLNAIGKFVADERKQREHMLDRHPDRSEYWQGRIAQADVVLADVSVLLEHAKGGDLTHE